MGEEEGEWRGGRGQGVHTSTKEADLRVLKQLEKFDRPGIAELDLRNLYTKISHLEFIMISIIISNSEDKWTLQLC